MRKAILLVYLVLGFFVVNGQVHDSITTAVEPSYDSVGKLHRFLFGDNYRKVWSVPVKMRVVHIFIEKGGLTPVEKGGGLQTKSLKLKDKSGQEWVLRSIQKYPEKGLPKNLRKTIAKDILQDQVSTGHPYAALTVPVLADAVGISHTNPEVVYVANDNDLGEYQKDFGGTVMLLEEKYADGKKTDKTEKIQDRLEADNGNTVNQQLLLRARLLDLVIGDWDRHGGNWGWEEETTDSGTIYNPKPTDRDKVFYSTSGLFPTLLSHQFLKANLQAYKSDIRSADQYNYNNRYFDRYFLNEMNEADWQAAILYVQQHLSDEVINRAMNQLPAPVYRLTAQHIISTLKARRDLLANEGMKYYRFLSKTVDIVGSDKQEQFLIENISDKGVQITISKAGEGGPSRVLFSRTFTPTITKEVRLYGLKGNDRFVVKGDPHLPVKIRMIGGKGADTFVIANSMDSRRKLYIYDSTGERNVLPTPATARIKTRADSAVNYWQRNSFKYDEQGAKASLLYNIDQGLLLGLSYEYVKHGFRKEPFAEQHRFAAGYSTVRQAFSFSYSAYLTKVLAKNDLSIKLDSRGPRNVSNFFGIGNETVFINEDDKGIDFYRNRFDIATADVRLVRNIGKGITLTGGVAALYYGSSTKNNQATFFKTYNQQKPTDFIFHNRFYAGLVAGLEVDTRNEPALPTAGLYWNVQLQAMQQTNDAHDRTGRLFTELSVYAPITKDSSLVVANRIGGGTTVGKPSFFQMMQLGGVRYLRGFHTNRFTGNSMLFHNIDVRYKLLDFNSYLLPGTVGVVAFNDVGRVWVPGEHSNKWHHAYGGGMYVQPAQLFLVQAIAGISTEGVYPYISIGFTF